ncbi:DUF4291 domain-containing protein [Streptomyces sp. YIM 98790]|uniref:DUF4291 domain-containing protein n=1 Tax=Streptomyces sp. YIM 98790 TaxID=2689077 RepID=UPI00140D1F2F|nr:DUF4291 domain-containing protein [Streptomyces sp. YIM 98790]
MREKEPYRAIRARFSEETITVYQAYRPEIGLPAARTGQFPSMWRRERMTWIKPSFLWMMYRCGWAAKQDQETVLGIEITRDGFEWALRHACLSHHDRRVYPDEHAWKQELARCPARVQWDPERDLYLRPLPYRSLQLGLAGEATRRYADEWIVAIEDVTPLAKEIRRQVAKGEPEAAEKLLPQERPYPAQDVLLSHLR